MLTNLLRKTTFIIVLVTLSLVMLLPASAQIDPDVPNPDQNGAGEYHGFYDPDIPMPTSRALESSQGPIVSFGGNSDELAKANSRLYWESFYTSGEAWTWLTKNMGNPVVLYALASVYRDGDFQGSGGDDKPKILAGDAVVGRVSNHFTTCPTGNNLYDIRSVHRATKQSLKSWPATSGHLKTLQCYP
jgi:hypothetical protein